MIRDNTGRRFFGYSVVWLVLCGMLIAVAGGILFHSIEPLIAGWIPFWVAVVYLLSTLMIISYAWAFDRFDKVILPDEDLPPMFGERKGDSSNDNYEQ